MKRDLNFALLFSVLMVFCLGIEKSSAQWTSPGPDGGYVSLITASGSTLYAVAGVFSPNAEYLYTSTDNGSTWSPLPSATWPAGPSNTKKAIAKFGNSLFVGTFNGIWRSEDNGLTWVQKYASGAGYAFAANGTTLFAGTDYGVIKSADNGETWTFNDLGAFMFGGIVTLAVNGNNVYASSEMDGITVHSENNGETYTQYGDIWFDASALTIIGNDLYAGTNYNGLYKLTNCAGLWAQVYAGANYCKGLVGDATVIIATSLSTGVVRSTDGGATWTDVTGNGIVQYNTSNCSPAVMTPAGIFVGTMAGIYKTTDNGNTWSRSDAGIHACAISAPAVSALGTDIYTGSDYGGVFRSTNDGQSFTDVSNSLVVNIPVVPGHPYLVGTNSTAVFSGAYQSTDGGTTWAPHNSPGSLGNIPWMEQGGALITINQFEGVYRSLNNGATWTLSNSGITTLSSFLQLYSDGTVLYLGGNTNNSAQTGAYFSTDNGATWHISVFPAFPPMIGSFFSTGTTMLMSGAMAGWGSSEGVYRSTNNGENWTLVLAHCAVTKWAKSGTTLYFTGNTELMNGSPSKCIYVSENDGLTWNLATIPDNMNPSAFAVDGQNIFLGTTNAKILYSKDKCVTWTDVSYTGNYPKIFASNLTIFNNKIYAASNGGSLLARNLGDFSEPAMPGTIAGSATPCRNTSQIYSVPDVAGITYTWQFPSGWIITAGGTTSSVTVTVGTATGIVLVTPSNAWGSGQSQYMVVTQTLAGVNQPGVITGPANPMQGSSQNYSVVSVPGVSYAWTFPAGWVQTGGGTTNSVTVTVGSGSGDVVVTPSNDCGNGTPRTLAVIPTPITYAVTFNVDMSTAAGFIPGTDLVYLTGNFPGASWVTPGDAGSLVMSQVGETLTYTYTMTIVPGTYEYKYFKNAGWDGGEYAGVNNRMVAVSAAATISDTWGGSINWANLQWPGTGSVNLGVGYDVYAQAYIPNGITYAPGVAYGLQAWIGYSTGNTDPSTWTNWVAAPFSGQPNDNDEFKANLGAAITTPGTYYYASRFQFGTGAFVYGGFNGGFWNGTTNVSGMLTVISSIPEVVSLENITVAGEITTCYNALQTIYVAGGTTTFTVQPGGSATMIAGQNILYQPGTTVLSGGYMLGMISTGTYCPGQAKSLISADAGSDENLFNINQVNFTIYPNPTTGNFTLAQKGDKLYGNVKVEVFSMRGEKVMTETIIGEKMNDFRFSDMATGLYFVKVVADGYVETMKLIKL